MSDTTPIKLYTALLAAPVFGAMTGKMVQLGQRNKEAGAEFAPPPGMDHQEVAPMTESQYTSVRLCAAPGCEKPHSPKSVYCGTHRSRLHRYGGFDAPKRPAHIQPIVDEETGCHNWAGYTNQYGYGVIGRGDGSRLAHRYYWVQRHGPIPEGMQLDHLCRNRRCCNPDHLEVVTPAENMRRGNSPSAIVHRENRCQRGHELTPENTYLTSAGYRTCRTCLRAAWKRADARKEARA